MSAFLKPFFILNKQKFDLDIYDDSETEYFDTESEEEEYLYSSEFESEDHNLPYKVRSSQRLPWQHLKSTNRDRSVSISTPGYYGSIDQTSRKMLGAETSCSMMSLSIVYWLFQNNVSHDKSMLYDVNLPTPAALDRILEEGAQRWHAMNKLPRVRSLSRSDGFHEIDTVIKHGAQVINKGKKKNKVSIKLDESFTGYFNPSPYLVETDWNNDYDESMSFDSVWKSVIKSAKDKSQTYIVGWNSHFFVLHIPKAESDDDPIYVIDSLGWRFSPGCKQAYVLQFNSDTQFSYGLNSHMLTLSATSVEDLCRLYLSDFLAGDEIRKACQKFEAGHISKLNLLEVLQIDFYGIRITSLE